MIEQSLSRLEQLIQVIPEKLSAISESDFSFKPTPEKWSKKEILGHLLDSATNNHQRFVRGQFEEIPAGSAYAQNEWVKYSFYQEMDSKHLIAFWKMYHQHLVEIIKRIPASALPNKIKIREDYATLEFLIIDYVEHQEHHLRQLVEY